MIVLLQRVLEAQVEPKAGKPRSLLGQSDEDCWPLSVLNRATALQ